MVSAMTSTIWMANMLTNNRLMLGGKRLTSFKSIKPLRKKIVGIASTREIDPVRMTLPSKPACWNIFYSRSRTYSSEETTQSAQCIYVRCNTARS